MYVIKTKNNKFLSTTNKIVNNIIKARVFQNKEIAISKIKDLSLNAHVIPYENTENYYDME